MTYLSVFSYGFISFGPMIVLFGVTVARKPHEIIIMITSAFFWLLSLLMTSIVWIIVPPLKYNPVFTIPFSVFFQEFFRWLLFQLLNKADKVLEVLSNDKTPRRKHRVAYVSGLGFGIVSAISMFSNILRESGGPGIPGINDRQISQYFVLTMALGASVMVVLHICWSVLWFDCWNSLYTRGFTKLASFRSWANLALVFITHMVLALLSLLNAAYSPVYFLSAAYLCALFLTCYSLFTVGLRLRNIKHMFKI